LLTDEGEIDQILWLRFGKSYLILESVLFYRIESCFAVIARIVLAWGINMSPPGYCKD